MNARRAGVLLHPTSLPGPGPIGTLGSRAEDFIDWLSDAGCTLWQVLPLNPPGHGLCPYDSPGAMVTATELIDIPRLIEGGLLDRAEVPSFPRAGPEVDLAAVHSWHRPLTRRAARTLAEEDPTALERFVREHPPAADWALYQALRHEHGVGGWQGFPQLLRQRHPDALSQARERLADDIAIELALQLIVDRQWQRLRSHARTRGVRIFGDLPLFVSAGGVDPWAYPQLFCWNAWGQSDPVSGAPPDYFNELGQCWGTPHYDWPNHESTGFSWWRLRFRAVFRHADVVRIDHFRGLSAAWAIPAAAEGDARLGMWRPTPGTALLEAVRDELGSLPVVAEDLGYITEDVEAMRDGFGLMGMKVLQFGFGSDEDNPHLPHTWEHDRWAAYTGTHDNATSRAWYETTDEATQDHFRRYTKSDGSEPAWSLLELAWESCARWAVAPLQDVLGLGAKARMNAPGTIEGNWVWRATEIPDEAGRRLRALAQRHDRDPRAG